MPAEKPYSQEVAREAERFDASAHLSGPAREASQGLTGEDIIAAAAKEKTNPQTLARGMSRSQVAEAVAGKGPDLTSQLSGPAREAAPGITNAEIVAAAERAKTNPQTLAREMSRSDAETMAHPEPVAEEGAPTDEVKQATEDIASEMRDSQ